MEPSPAPTPTSTLPPISSSVDPQTKYIPPAAPMPAASIPAPNPSCPRCHVAVRPTDFYCYNCGAEVQEKPVHVSIPEQLGLYLGSLILPPMGLFWGFKYYRKKGHQPKVVGLIAVLLTLTSTVVATIYSIQLMNQVSEQVNQRVSNFQAM